ncbi:MAG: shikimate dehydrogenase [Betaproteobacteria bacterium]|nr:shikimate dehydrogenase [Betaproteobacteria bacterium]MCC6250761.1 shikimate dehydrogenase [Rubrivivax sp.]
MPDKDTPRYAVLGNPVAHSRSPFIHEAFARQCGLPISYERVLSPLDAFEATLQAFAAAGGRGVNITVPFKFQALAMASRRTPRAVLAGAANVLKLDEPDGWLADNTDGVGLVRDIEAGAGVALAGRRVLLLGAGGAAAGALGPLIAARPAEIVLANRTRPNAEAIAAAHAAWADRHRVTLAVRGFDDAGEAFDVVVNATSSSLAGAGVPVGARVLARGALALDMMYGAAAATFLRWAEAAGARARDGLGMLVEQAAEAFFVFRGVMPHSRPVLATLQAQIEAEAAVAGAAATDITPK